MLLKVLTYDRDHMEHLKFADVYRQMLDKIMDEIMKEMAELRRYFRQSPGRIIETKKEHGNYVVGYTYRGYQFEAKYLKEFIRVECGEILKEYLRRCLPDG
jgi:transcription initiation factor IIE alpha subunit